MGCMFHLRRRVAATCSERALGPCARGQPGEAVPRRLPLCGSHRRRFPHSGERRGLAQYKHSESLLFCACHRPGRWTLPSPFLHRLKPCLLQDIARMLEKKGWVCCGDRGTKRKSRDSRSASLNSSDRPAIVNSPPLLRL